MKVCDFMSKGRMNDFYTQYEELITKFEEQEKMLKETNKLIKNLNSTIKSLTETNQNLQKLLEEKDKEILRLKSKNDKNSSNSSKPSSTNGYKKVITNRREKSNKNQGGQRGHKAHSLNNKLNQFVESGDVIEEIIEVNKTANNENKKYMEKIVIDIKVVKIIKKYRYFPDENGNYNIPKYHNQKIQYGPVVKAISTNLMNHLYNSTDGVTRFIEDITNGGITLSKGTLILWQNNLANILETEVIRIENELRDSYYINHDESQIKIDGDNYNMLCACNEKHVRLWVHKHKSQEALKEIEFLPTFHGVIVKDGTELYNPFGSILAQCISHIQRYLKGIYDNIKHIGPKEMSKFLSECNDIRNDLISEGVRGFTANRYSELIMRYDQILDMWEKELREDTNNYLFDEEEKLFKRMKYDNKKMDSKIRGDREEILYFLKDFKVPSTNNPAELAQRNGKIKQKIGKWRSFDGAEDYMIIRSCINTYKKNKINVFNALISAFSDNVVIV